jgi:hypothetical protein
MALTLSEGNKYSATTLAGYVIDRLAKSDPILQVLPFVDIPGNSLTYNTITTRSPSANFYNVGDTWVEGTPTITQATATLTILGGDADIDNFLKATRSNILDLRGEILNDKIKSVKEKFLDSFYYGSGTAPEFTGLQGLLTSSTYNTVSLGSSTTGAVLSIVKLQSAIDLIANDWQPSMMVMTKTMRRYINVYLDSIGDKFTEVRDNFGKMIEYFRGIQLVTSDHIANVESISGGVYSASTGGACSSIFILTFDPKAVCGLQSPAGIQTVQLGDLETKDAERVRIRWYCGLKLEDLRSCAKVDGADPDGTVTA